jgi:hypothetical protein
MSSDGENTVPEDMGGADFCLIWESAARRCNTTKETLEKTKELHGKDSPLTEEALIAYEVACAIWQEYDRQHREMCKGGSSCGIYQ